jgi:hypothetical protein
MARFNDKTEMTMAAIEDYATALKTVASDLQTIVELADHEGIGVIYPTHFKSGTEALEKIIRFATEVRYAYGLEIANRNIKLKVAEDAAKYEAANVKAAADAIQKTRKKRPAKDKSE